MKIDNINIQNRKMYIVYFMATRTGWKESLLKVYNITGMINSQSLADA